MKTTIKIILTSLTGLMLAGTSNAAIDAAMLEKACVNKGNSWVVGADSRSVCVPEDPCSSEDANIRGSFCVTSASDIPLDMDGTLSRAYCEDGTCFSYENKEYKGIKTKEDCTAVKLKPGEWAVRFPTYVVKGKSMCSGQQADKYAETMSEDVLKVNGGKKNYCWCKAEGLYKAITDEFPRTSLSPSSWVFVDMAGRGGSNDADFCKAACALNCAGAVRTESGFRKVVYYGGN